MNTKYANANTCCQIINEVVVLRDAIKNVQ